MRPMPHMRKAVTQTRCGFRVCWPRTGNARAQSLLAEIYYHGRGVSRDDLEAIEWFRRAADQGNIVAQFHLGDIYTVGRGVAGAAFLPTPHAILHLVLHACALTRGGRSVFLSESAAALVCAIGPCNASAFSV